MPLISELWKPRALYCAVKEGYPLKGYFQWSLTDNFEWADGYSDVTRMGLYNGVA